MRTAKSCPSTCSLSLSYAFYCQTRCDHSHFWCFSLRLSTTPSTLTLFLIFVTLKANARLPLRCYPTWPWSYHPVVIFPLVASLWLQCRDRITKSQLLPQICIYGSFKHSRPAWSQCLVNCLHRRLPSPACHFSRFTSWTSLAFQRFSYDRIHLRPTAAPSWQCSSCSS